MIQYTHVLIHPRFNTPMIQYGHDSIRPYQFLVWAACEEGGVRYGVREVGLEEVLSESSRRLISHLHSILEHRHWELGYGGMEVSISIYMYLQYTREGISLSNTHIHSSHTHTLRPCRRGMR